MQQTHTAETSARETTGARRKQSVREMTGRATEAVGARDGRAQERAESDKRYISGNQWRELPDKPNTSRSA